MTVDNSTLYNSILQVTLIILSGTPAYQKIKANQASAKDTLTRIEKTIGDQFAAFETRLHNLEIIAFANTKTKPEQKNANTTGNNQQPDINRLHAILDAPLD